MKSNYKKGIETIEIFSTFFPNTLPCVDVKLLTFLPGHMSDGDELLGSLRKDSEDHLTFTEMLLPTKEEKKSSKKTYPKLFKGEFISLTQRDDNTLRVHFRDFEIGPDMSRKQICSLTRKIHLELNYALLKALGLIEEPNGLPF